MYCIYTYIFSAQVNLIRDNPLAAMKMADDEFKELLSECFDRCKSCTVKICPVFLRSSFVSLIVREKR